MIARLTLQAALYLTLATLSAAASAVSQPYPTRPIRLVLPFAPGGASDALARLLAPKLSEELGQQVIVENRGGGGGNVAAAAVAGAPPDGYTILQASAMLTTNKSLYSKLSYDPEADFAPVAHLAGGPYVLVSHPSLPVGNVQDLVSLAKSQPGSLFYASSGIGGASHLAGELLKLEAGIAMQHVAYRGGGPAVLAVLSGEPTLLFGTIASSLTHIKAGSLKPLAVSGLKRSAKLPDVPTIDESGIKGFDVTTWDAFVVPRGTPEAVILRLNEAAVNVLRNAEMQERIRGIGYEPTGSSPEELGRFMRSETAVWSRVIKATGMRVE